MLLLIGSLSGTWLISGVIPTMIYYGLQILDPYIFLFATAIITAIISISTGSSWSTIATVGIALLGVGFSLSLLTPSDNAKQIYNNHLPTIGIDTSFYKYKVLDYVITPSN